MHLDPASGASESDRIQVDSTRRCFMEGEGFWHVSSQGGEENVAVDGGRVSDRYLVIKGRMMPNAGGYS